MIKNLIYIGLGGALGSVLRYLVSFYTHKKFESTFPWPTFFVNILGCLLIGILFGYFEKNVQINSEYRLLGMTGFCGGFTTFSAFSIENLHLLQNDHALTAIFYTISSVSIGILAVWTGIKLYN